MADTSTYFKLISATAEVMADTKCHYTSDVDAALASIRKACEAIQRDNNKRRGGDR